MSKTLAAIFTAEERQEYIGVSELAAAMGVDKWKTPLDLYNEKRGLVEPFTGNAHTERGNRLEAVAAEEYARIAEVQLRRSNKEFVHPVHSFIRGHIDRVVVGEKRLVEIKCPSVAAYRRFQREGLPDSFIIQAQGYMGLTGYDKLTWVIFAADQWDLVSFDLEFDETIYNAAIDAAVKLWTDHIVPGIPPEADAKSPTIEFEKIGGDVVFRDDEEFTAAALALREAIQLKNDATELFDLSRQKMIEVIGDTPGRYEGAGLRLSYTESAGRKSFDQKALAAAHPELDLEPFTKIGKPVRTFRPFLLGE